MQAPVERKRNLSKRLFASLVLLAIISLTGCQNMRDQPRYEPLEVSQFFPDMRSARPIVDNTVPREREIGEEPFLTGRDEAGDYLTDLPVPLTQELMQRGRERYDIFCAPCHGADGYGGGMIVQRGFSPPPSFHSEQLRQRPLGYYFDVISNGFGRMFEYGSRIPVEDRWAISAYIRALQLSQYATIQDVPPDGADLLSDSE